VKLTEDRRWLAVDEDKVAEHTATRLAKRAERKKKQTTLPARFKPNFLDEADGRIATVKELRRRIDLLKVDTASDSYQKDILCQRAVFIACQLETQERAAIEGGEFHPGTYTQMVNALVGLLRSLGLEKQAKEVESLEAYAAKKSRRTIS